MLYNCYVIQRNNLISITINIRNSNHPVLVSLSKSPTIEKNPGKYKNIFVIVIQLGNVCSERFNINHLEYEFSGPGLSSYVTSGSF